MTKRKAGLKRGLDALLAPKAATPQTVAEAKNDPNSDLRNLPVEFLQPGKYQPRKDMTEEGLDELADSITAQGVIQPIVVRPLLGSEKFEIIAGERRWRASQKAGLHEVPTIVKDVDDNAAIAMSLIENIQREDLNAIDEATALSRLQKEFELTHQEVADAVGKSRTAVTNLMRLLSLSESVRLLIEHGDLEMGHGRALLALAIEQQPVVAKQVVEKGLSVRETENLVKKIQNPKPRKPLAKKSSDIKSLERSLSEHLGSPALLQHGKGGKGKLVLQYSSLEELDGILSKMGMPKS